MDFFLVLSFEDPEAKIFDLLRAEAASSSRSKVSFKHEGSKSECVIEARDSVALRASFNSVTKLLTVYENMSKLEDEN